MDLKDQVKEWLNKSDNIVFFGGAGVSTASGIPDFRSSGGLYKKKRQLDYSPEYILSYEFLEKEPDKFQEFVKEELIIEGVKPNKAHLLLAELEKKGKIKGIVTQNIDSLHQMAGSKHVVEIHGNLRDFYCPRCYKKFDQEYFLQHAIPVTCDHCQFPIRPNIVLYGESLDPEKIRMAQQLIRQADVLIVGGTSLQVYPAAGFIHQYRGNKMILINKDHTMADAYAQAVFHEDIVQVLGELLS